MLLRNGYAEATGQASTPLSPSVQLECTEVAPLPPPIAGTALEAFLRQLLPFYAQTLLSIYPRVVTSRSVVDAFLSLFDFLPSSDLLLLRLLALQADRAAALLTELIRDRGAMPRWRQVLDMLPDEDGGEQDEEGHTDGRRPDEDQREQTPPALPAATESSAPEWMHRVPPNVRLPRAFPRESFAPARSLLLLFLQLVQQLDGSLFPRGLALLEVLLTDTLDPRRPEAAVATALRSSVLSLIHQTLVRSFDLVHRARAVEWFVALSRRLSIPLAPKEQPQPLPKKDTEADNAKGKQGGGIEPSRSRRLSQADQERLRQLAALRQHNSPASASARR